MQLSGRTAPPILYRSVFIENIFKAQKIYFDKFVNIL